ncbi:MAG: RHS repeat-associated core domain-containing protein, partial [Bacteroidales bacterium]|nr:RHS repeat-associated core domain-containing protein [Bacteroidales bacterium]
AIVELYAFDAYGNAIGFDPSVALTEFLYSGEQFDSKIGQQYLRQRYYDPATGRFNRLDPFFGVLIEPLSFNKYLYTHSDPINNTDPSGKFIPILAYLGIVLGGGIICAGLGAMDAWLGNESSSNIWYAAGVNFAIGAAATAAIVPLAIMAAPALTAGATAGSLYAFTALFQLQMFGMALGLFGTLESIAHGRYKQAGFRAFTTVGGTWLGFRGLFGVKIGNQKINISATEEALEANIAAKELAKDAALYSEMYRDTLDATVTAFMKPSHSKPARIGTMYDPITKNKITMSSYDANLPPIEMIPQECLDMLNKLGGLYAKITIDGQEYSVGTCWEFKAFVHLKIKNPALQPSQVKYTKSYMPRTFKPDDPCPVCQSMFGTDGLIPEQ